MSLWTRDSWKNLRRKSRRNSWGDVKIEPDPKTVDFRAIVLLCDQLTVGVCSFEDKREWMEPAIVSHVARLLRVNDDDVRNVVKRWFSDKTEVW